MKQFVLKGIWLIYQVKSYILYLFSRIKTPLNIHKIQKMISEDKLLSELDSTEKETWENRIKTTMSSPDNHSIVRHYSSGTIEGDYLIMHNGLKVDPLSYYGLPPLKLLIDNKGVHEPQEEKVFQEVLKKMPENAVMIELGSYWAFYSMWFYSKVKKARCYMIEAELANIKLGKKNFKINNMKGFFYQAFLGDKTFITHKGERFITLDYFVKKNKINFIDILHSDIQGYEYKMLQAAEETFASKKIGYVFISTHTNEIHSNCLNFLKKFNFSIIAEVNLDESYSADGIIVAVSPDIKNPPFVEILKR